MLFEDLNRNFSTTDTISSKKGGLMIMENKNISKIQLNQLDKSKSPKKQFETDSNCSTPKANHDLNIKTVYETNFQEIKPIFNMDIDLNSLENYTKLKVNRIDDICSNMNSTINRGSFDTFSIKSPPSMRSSFQLQSDRLNAINLNSDSNYEEDKFNTSKNTIEVSRSNSILSPQRSEKDLYREFVKLFLKIKFEKIDIEHSGQLIDQKALWGEALKLKIQKNGWKDFILTEIKNPKKYTNLTTPKKQRKAINQQTTSMKKFKGKMDIIKEELI